MGRKNGFPVIDPSDKDKLEERCECGKETKWWCDWVTIPPTYCLRSLREEVS